MKKYLSFMAFAIVAAFSLVFVSCSSDDDNDENYDLGENQIEINDTKQTVYGSGLVWFDLVAIYGEDWMRDLYGDEYLEQNKALFSIVKLNGDCYNFEWTCPYEPKKGDIISNMKNFVMPPDITGQKKDIEYTYSSGSAKIVDANVAKEEITIQFDKLKMANGSDSFTFNGKVVFSFDNN